MALTNHVQAFVGHVQSLFCMSSVKTVFRAGGNSFLAEELVYCILNGQQFSI